MTGQDLKRARKHKGWTQEHAAKRLDMSQEYLSMLESDHRSLPASRLRKIVKTLHVYPLALPTRGERAWHRLDSRRLAVELAALGYPGFGHIKATPKWNPQELLLAALTRPNVESRNVEALPWLVLRYNNMDWDWVMRESKVHDAQNRLGFVLTLACELAQLQGNAAADHLREIEEQLKGSLLMKPGTFCHENMTRAERKWLQQNSTPEARQWNILSDLSPEHLIHS